MKITFKRLLEFVAVSNGYLAQLDGKENKLTYALTRFTKLNQSAIDEYNEKLTDFRIDFASVDSNKNLIKDNQGQLTFTKENQKKLNTAIKELNSQEVEIESYYCTEVPEGLQLFTKEIFSGLIIIRSELEPAQ